MACSDIHSPCKIGTWLLLVALTLQLVGLTSSHWLEMTVESIDGTRHEVHTGLFVGCTKTADVCVWVAHKWEVRGHLIIAQEIIAAIAFITAGLISASLVVASSVNRHLLKSMAAFSSSGGCLAATGVMTFLTSEDVEFKYVSWSLWLTGSGGVVGFLSSACFVTEANYQEQDSVQSSHETEMQTLRQTTDTPVVKDNPMQEDKDAFVAL